MNAFEVLGLPVGLVISDGEIRDAFRKRAGEAHPDSGGNEADFSSMQVAQEVLLSPSKRLREWLPAKGETADPRGQIESGLMDLFQKVAEVGAGAEAAVKASGNAQSALAKGMAEVLAIGAREKVSTLLAGIDDEIKARVSGFADIEESENFQGAAKSMRDLVFLEKWRGTLKGIYGRLI